MARHSTLKKITAIILGTLAILLLIVLLFGEKWAKRFINHKMSRVEAIAYDSIAIEVIDQQITFYNISTHQKAIDIEVKILRINDLNLFNLVFFDRYDIGNITLDSAKVNYRMGKRQSEDRKSIPDLRIGNIEVENSLMTIYKNQQPVLHTQFELRLKDIDQKSLARSRQLLPKITYAKLKELIYFNNAYYTTSLGEATYYEDIIDLQHLAYTSTQDKLALGRDAGHEKDWINMKIDSAILNVDHLGRLIYDHDVSKVFLFEGDLHVFRDKRLPFPENQRPPLLKELLANSINDFKIDSIFVINADIVYEEWVAEEPRPGKVTFNNMNGYFSNIYTYNHAPQKPAHLVMKSKLFNETNLYVDVSFPLTVKGNTHVKGHLEAMDLTTFNQMLAYVTPVRIKRGQLSALDFNFSYGMTESTGEMHFNYTNLQIAFRDVRGRERAYPSSNGFLNSIKTWIANTFVLGKKNTADQKSYRVGAISYNRNPQKSMFNFWWNSLLTGFKSSTGIIPKAETEEE
ncbi:MAG: hypothetical protein R3345_10690 [Fulvivirga sp.]|nr:hypothetical protein [Fulvivirga sp.]